MTATGTQYVALVYKQKKCPEHDAPGMPEADLYERIDCGCIFQVEIGRYRTLNIARLVCVRHVKLKGYRQYGGNNTGYWDIETEEGETIEVGHND